MAGLSQSVRLCWTSRRLLAAVSAFPLCLGLALCASRAVAQSPASGESLGPEVNPGADAEAELVELRRLWQERAGLARRVRYRLSGTAFHAAGSVVSAGDMGPDVEVPGMPSTGYPVEDTAYDVTIDWLIDFESGMFRKESRDQSFNMTSRAYRPFVRTEVFDGQGLKGHWPRAENTSPQYTPHRDQEEVLFWKEDDVGLVTNSVDLPVYYAHGLYGIQPGELSAASLAGHRELVLAGRVEKGGVVERSILAETDVGGRSINYHVDPARGGAIIRRDIVREGITLESLEIEYADGEHGWLPARWISTHYSGSKNPERYRVLFRYTLTVDEIEFDPVTAQADFQIPLQPGMIVLRRDRDFTKEQVAPDGSLVPYSPLTDGANANGSTARGIVVLINILMVCVVAGVMVVRRRKQTGSPPQSERKLP